MIDLEINHEEFVAIFKEKDKYEKMKQNNKNVIEKEKKMRLNSLNSRTEKNKFVNMWLVKNYKTLYEISFFLYIYKMYIISVEGYKLQGLALNLGKHERCWKWYGC